MQIPMQAIHHATDVDTIYKWALVYGEDTIKGIRDYRLLLNTEGSNSFTIDEGNTILLKGYHHHNVYVSKFSVAGNDLTSVYRLLGKNEMLFEIFFSKSDPLMHSGNQIIGRDTIPEVTSYDIPIYQVATLYKK